MADVGYYAVRSLALAGYNGADKIRTEPVINGVAKRNDAADVQRNSNP